MSEPRPARPLIRAATPGDAAAIAALEPLLFGDDAWSAAQVHDELTGPGRRAWVTVSTAPATASAVAPALVPASVLASVLESGRAVAGGTGSGEEERGDGISGYAVTMTLGDVADLQRIGVRPDARRRGQARSLLATAFDAALGDGAERMLLEVSAANTAALAFYEAVGFARIDRRPRYYRDGSDALVLCRALAARGSGG